jgi:hypothetical protein
MCENNTRTWTKEHQKDLTNLFLFLRKCRVAEHFLRGAWRKEVGNWNTRHVAKTYVFSEEIGLECGLSLQTADVLPTALKRNSVLLSLDKAQNTEILLRFHKKDYQNPRI